MSEPLDVSLRVRMRYEAGDGAARATTDLEKVRTTAERLGAAATGGERLNQGLRNTSTLAQAVQADLLRLSSAATRLGSGEVGGRLASGLKDAGQAAGGAAREITQLGQAAARFGAVSTVSYLARDLKAVHAPAQAAKRDMDALREAADKVGRGTGLRDLDADLQKAARRADDLERRLAGVNRRTGGRGGHGEHMEFANEALRASGLGVGGLRFGMGGAAAGGLAAGGALAATGGAIAMATGQAISFEHAMTEVKKAVNDTPEGLRSLERDILGFSRATGLAKNEIAALVAQAGYLNVPRDQLKGFAEIATKAAVGFQMRPEETGEALGHLRAAYGLKDNAQLRSAGDAINTIGDHVGTRERDVLNYLNRTSGVAGMLRIPLAKNAAIGGAVMSLGVAPDVAATGFDSLSGRLANANLEGKDFQRGLRAIHLSGRRAKAMMQEDATGGLIEVLERLKDLPEAKRINAIRDIAGEGNVAAVSRMVESLDKLKEALALVADPSKYAGSLEKTFKIFSSDTQAQIKRAEAAMESWAAKIGSKFSPAVSTAAAAVERWFNAMSKAMDRREQAEGIARRMAKGGVPTPEEQARIDADPRLKRSVDEQLFYRRRADEIEAGRKRLVDPPAEGAPLPPSMGAARDAFRRKAEEFERRRNGEAIPGTGKRSDLQEGVKASLASYHEEVESGLTRTERLAREMGRRIREDLEIRTKVQDIGLHTCGCADGVRIERASINGGTYGYGSGFGAGGGFGGGAGGGARGMPGRFGGSVPMPHGGRGLEGGPAGGGGANTPRGSGAGTTGSARTGQMMAFAMDQLRREGVPEEHLRQAAAHLVGQAQMESGLDPNKVHDGGTGYGIYGARDPHPGRGRRTDMLRWLKENGYAPNSAEGQMRYMAHEAMSGRYRRTRDILMGQGSGDVDRDTNTITGEFESPAIINRRSGAVRDAMRRGPEDAASREAARPGPSDGHAGGNGQFDPLGGATRRYTSRFGMRDHPIRGGRRMHYGQDMAAPAGTPVSAMQGGRITAISRMGDVTVTHADGSTKTYRHIDPSGLKVGQEIEGGAQIGTLRARDPRSTGPHLHLEATDAQGRRYDPRAEIDGAGRPGANIAGGPSREMAEPRRGGHDQETGIRQLQPWTRRHPAEEGAGASSLPGRSGRDLQANVSLTNADARHERASIDDFLDNMQRNPAYQREQEESRRRYRDQTEGPREGESFHDFYRRRATPGMGFSESEAQTRKGDGSGDSEFGSVRGLNEELSQVTREKRGDRGVDGTTYEERLEQGVQSRRRRPNEFTPDRELSLDEIRRFRGPDSETRSPRYGDPSSRQLRSGAGGADPGAAGSGGGTGSGGPSVIQNFHGGFDAHEVGRRAQLEQNREVRRTMAGALHDVGHPVSV